MLHKGSRGSEVSELQSILNQVSQHHPPLKVDGVFGPLTRAAVIRFQRATHGLTATGQVDDATFNSLVDKFGEVLRRRGVAVAKEEARLREQRRRASLKRTLKSQDVANLIRVHSKDLPRLQSLLGGLGMKNLRTYLGNGVDIVKALNLLGSLDYLAGAAYGSTSSVAMTAGMNIYGTGAITSTASVAVGSIIFGSSVMLGNLLFLLKCASKIASIYNDALLTYALRSVAYTMTAWVFDKPQVDQSGKVLGNSWSITTEETPKYHKAWKDAQLKTLDSMKTISFGTLSAKEFKEAMQIVYGNNEQAFCRDVMRALTPRVPDGPNRSGWVNSLKAGTAYAYPD